MHALRLHPLSPYPPPHPRSPLTCQSSTLAAQRTTTSTSRPSSARASTARQRSSSASGGRCPQTCGRSAAVSARGEAVGAPVALTAPPPRLAVLMELYTGELLFQTHDSAEHLALIEACVGQLPRSMTTARTPEVRVTIAPLRSPPRACAVRVRCPMQARRFFDRHGRSTYPLPGVPSDSVRHVRAQRRLQDIVSDRDTVGRGCAVSSALRASLTWSPPTAAAAGRCFSTSSRPCCDPTLPHASRPRTRSTTASLRPCGASRSGMQRGRDVPNGYS